MFDGKRVLVTGGAGSLGSVLIDRLLMLDQPPERIVVFSRDEAKHHLMRMKYQKKPNATEDVTYSDFLETVRFQIGDIRNYHSVARALSGVDVVIHAAAIKQVPTIEYNPYEALQTNVGGIENIISAINEHDLNVESVVSVSTDKACTPINAYGMTKALMERVAIAANLICPETRFVLTRYGNVMGSVGSVIPLFLHLKKNGIPLTVTDTRMTRFMLNLDQAVDTIFHTYESAKAGDIVIPRLKSARLLDIATAISDQYVVTGIRPGERLHEPLVSFEESFYVREASKYLTIRPHLPELMYGGLNKKEREYSSQYETMSFERVKKMLEREGYI